MRFFLLLLLAAGCSGASGAVDAGSCPNDLPAACPSPAPSYAEVGPLVQARCLPCHAPGGVEATIELDTQATLHARRTSVLTQIYSCLMPLPDAGQLTAAERQAILGYLVCGAP